MKKLSEKHIKDMMTMGGVAYAQQEAWDIQNAASVLSQLGYMCINEADEPQDVKELAAIMRALMTFIEGELSEMEKASRRGDGYEKNAPVEMVPAQVKESLLNLSYVKSLGLATIPDLSVKFVARDQIRHPVFLWGNPEKTDLEREYFTRETDFWDVVIGKSVRPLTWDHAQDPDFKADPLIGKTIEWEDNDIGRFAVSVLEKSHKYRKAIDELIEKKALGSAAIATPIIGASSDSAPQYVQRVPVGKSTWLSRWPWFATALTPVPCEPRMIGSDGKGVEFLKSLGVQLPDANDHRLRYERVQREASYLKLKYER